MVSKVFQKAVIRDSTSFASSLVIVVAVVGNFIVGLGY